MPLEREQMRVYQAERRARIAAEKLRKVSQEVPPTPTATAPPMTFGPTLRTGSGLDLEATLKRQRGRPRLQRHPEDVHEGIQRMTQAQRDAILARMVR